METTCFHGELEDLELVGTVKERVFSLSDSHSFQSFQSCDGVGGSWLAIYIPRQETR